MSPMERRCLPLKAVFLDRDGTIIRHEHYLHRPEKVALLPGAAAALMTARGRGAELFLFTNQSGVGRGLYTLADVEAVNRRMIELLELGPAPFAGVCIAGEYPSDRPVYRKPSPRFILETMASRDIDPASAVMIGDNPSDWRAGLAAGIRVAAVQSHLLDDSGRRFLRAAEIPLFETLADWAEAEWPA